MAEKIEHFSLQELFMQGFFQIPDYQRGYAWLEEHRQDLLNDLEKIKDGRRHFTGTIVVHNKGYKKVGISSQKLYDIVDGQQRMTSVVILLYCIYLKLKELEHEDAEEIYSAYIQLKGIPKLKLAEPNLQYYIHILDGRQELIEYADNRTQQNLKNAYYQFYEYLNEQQKAKQGQFMEWLLELFEKLTNRIVFNFYEIEDGLSVGVVFEVVNDRGKGLSQLDKVKNFLMYSVFEIYGDEDRTEAEMLIDKINDTWAHVFQHLEIAGRWRTENEEQFLRVHWLICYKSDNKIYDVHKEVKKRFGRLAETSSEQFRDELVGYLDTLKEYAVHYRAAYSPATVPYLSVQVKDTIAGFHRMGNVSTALPLIMAFLHRFYKDNEKLSHGLTLLEKFVFRVAILADKKSNTGVNRVIRLANNTHSSQTACTDKEIIDELAYMTYESYVRDEEFQHYLTVADYDHYRWKGLRYFLYEYEKYLVSKMEGVRIYPWEEVQNRVRNKKETIEHILPQTISGISYWENRFDEKLHDKWLKRLGNLVLTDCNESLKNYSFGRKKGGPGKNKTYYNSGWAQERELMEFEDWEIEQIQLREERLVEFAIHRWGGKSQMSVVNKIFHQDDEDSDDDILDDDTSF